MRFYTATVTRFEVALTIISGAAVFANGKYMSEPSYKSTATLVIIPRPSEKRCPIEELWLIP